MRSWSRMMWSAVLLPLQKLDCVFDSRSNFSRYRISQFVASLSISLLSVDVSDISWYDDVQCGSFTDFNIVRTVACFQAFGRRPLRQIASNNHRMANLPVSGICWKNSYVIWSSPGAEFFFSC